MNGADDWSVECRADGTAVLRGVMRLDSPEAYDRALADVRERMLAAKGAFTLDLAEVLLMNSSGIRALGSLVLAAKKASVPLVIRGKAAVPWQKKSVASLQPLYPALRIELS